MPQLANERVIYRGFMYEAQVIAPGRTVRLYKYKTLRDDADPAADLEVIELGGETAHQVTLATDEANTFLTVFIRHAADDSVRYRTKIGSAGARQPDELQPEDFTKGFGKWRSLEGTAFDTPAAYGGNGFVAVDVLGGDGFKRQRVSTVAQQGITFNPWQFALGLGIPLGTNLLNGSTAQGGGFPQAAKDAIAALHPAIMRVRMFKSGDIGADGQGVDRLKPRFNLDDLEDLVGAGVRTLIINGAEGSLDYNYLQQVLTMPLGGTRNHGTFSLLQLSHRQDINWDKVNIFFELGNEPDRYYVDTPGTGYLSNDGGATSKANALSQRKAAIDTARAFYADIGLAAQYRNLRLMISLPTRLPNLRAGFNASNSGTAGKLNAALQEAREYFDIFTRAPRLGEDYFGQSSGVGYEFSAVAVHSYSNDCLRRAGTTEVSGEGPLTIVGLARDRSDRPLYLTESGVRAPVTPGKKVKNPNTGQERLDGFQSYQQKWEELGKRYVDGLAGFDLPDGRVRGVTYFQTALGDSNLNFRELNIDGDYVVLEGYDAQGNYQAVNGGYKNALPGYPAHTIMGLRTRAVQSGCWSATGDQHEPALRAAFVDVTGSTYGYLAIQHLVGAGITRGYDGRTDGGGRFGPGDDALRAQMAGFIVRAMDWGGENPANPFPDKGTVDDALWREVAILAAHGVARGYEDGTFKPTGPVLAIQAVSFVARAMVANNHWQQQPDDRSLYPNVPASSGHREDLATYSRYVGTVPGTVSGTQAFAGWDQPITRAGFALVLDRALLSVERGAATMASLEVATPLINMGMATAPFLGIVAATPSAAGSMAAADKAKLDGIAPGAQVNVLESISGVAPIAVAAAVAKNRVISIAAATPGAAGSLAAADKGKLDGIAPGAQANVIEDVQVGGAGGLARALVGKVLTLTTQLATAAAHGLMSAADKAKLDGATTQHNMGNSLVMRDYFGSTGAENLTIGWGSEARPSLAYAGEPETGLWRRAYREVVMSIGGIARARFWEGGLYVSGRNPIEGALVENDVKTWRPAAPHTGCVYLNAYNDRYLYCDGGAYHLTGLPLFVNGVYYASETAIKDGIADAPRGAVALRALRPKRFVYKEQPDQPRLGFLYEDLATVLPEATTPGRKGANGEDLPAGVDPMGLVAILVSGWQESEARAAALEARIAALETGPGRTPPLIVPPVLP